MAQSNPSVDRIRIGAAVTLLVLEILAGLAILTLAVAWL